MSNTAQGTIIRRFAALLTLSLIVALAAVATADARHAQIDDGLETPAAPLGAHATGGPTWHGSTQLIVVGIAALAVIVAAILTSRRRRRPALTH
jgi:hypothetical protein